MSSPQPAAVETASKDETYLKIWEIEQKHTTTRWTIAIFFYNVSFVIFGLSFDRDKTQLMQHVLQVAAWVIYCFGVFLFDRFSQFQDVLRDYLSQMESSKQTTLDIQQKVRDAMKQSLKVRHFMILFGIGYFIAILVLWYGLGL